MNRTSQRTQPTSLVEQLKRCLLIVVSLLVCVLILSFPVGIYNSNIQHNLDEQKAALQEGQNNILLTMVNQETGLRGYISTDNTVFLEPFTSGRTQYLLAVRQMKDQALGSDLSETTTALAQVEERANAWYSTYAQVQLKALVLSVVALLLLWYTFTRFVNVLHEQLTILKTRSKQLGSGDLSARVQELTYHELNSLGQTLNTMAEELATRSRELEGSVEELATRTRELEASNAAMYQLAAIVEYSGDAILGKTLQGVITSWNSGAEKLFGYAADEVIGKSVSLIIPPVARKSCRKC